MSVSICNDCTRRNCHKKPFATKREGRMRCYQFLPVNGGWSMLEILVDTSPVDLVILCHRFGLEVKKTKRGYMLYGNSKNAKRNRKRKGSYHKKKGRRQNFRKDAKRVSVDNESRNS